jgi:hypothetical protein
MAIPAENSLESKMIASLTKGKYYLQIGVYPLGSDLEREAVRMSNTYPVAIEPSTSNGGGSYRLLLGPLNQGESTALLQRLKKTGYNDAFIRIGR